MTRRGLIVLSATACLIVFMGADAWAQGRGGRQRPAAQPRSRSYLDLFRDYGYGGSFGPVDPYLMRYLTRNRSSASIRQPREAPAPGGTQTGPAGYFNPAVERARATKAAQAGAGGPAAMGVAPTGTGSVFMQYSHYFQAPAAGGRRR